MALESGSLVDVRQPGEYRLDGHLEGSTNVAAFSWEHGFHLASEDFAAEVAAAFSADAPIVLVCADGRLSNGAAAMLEGAGFSDVRTLEGGLNAWEWGDEDQDGEGLPAMVVDEDGEGGLTGAWV